MCIPHKRALLGEGSGDFPLPTNSLCTIIKIIRTFSVRKAFDITFPNDDPRHFLEKGNKLN